MDFKEKAPTYKVVQWDGTNAEEITNFWGWVQTPQTFVSKVEGNGDLRIGFDESYYFATVPAGNYLVAGPIWGDMPPQQLQTVPPGQFAERFEAAE